MFVPLTRTMQANNRCKSFVTGLNHLSLFKHGRRCCDFNERHFLFSLTYSAIDGCLLALPGAGPSLPHLPAYHFCTPFNDLPLGAPSAVLAFVQNSHNISQTVG